jgi:hypothetical protein
MKIVGEKELAKKGWKVVGLKEEVVIDVRQYLKEKEKGKFFPRSVPKFITEAIENQIAREKLESNSVKQQKKGS